MKLFKIIVYSLLAMANWLVSASAIALFTWFSILFIMAIIWPGTSWWLILFAVYLAIEDWRRDLAICQYYAFSSFSEQKELGLIGRLETRDVVILSFLATLVITIMIVTPGHEPSPDWWGVKIFWGTFNFILIVAISSRYPLRREPKDALQH